MSIFSRCWPSRWVTNFSRCAHALIVLGVANLFSAALAIEIEYLDDPVDNPSALSADGALLRSLDTIAGNVVDMEIRIGQTAETERFLITLHDCRYLPSNPKLHSYAFTEITQKSNREEIFKAWMIAHDPALSAVEHPRYDFWLIRCTTAAPELSNGVTKN